MNAASRSILHQGRKISHVLTRYEGMSYWVLRFSFGVVLLTHGVPKALGIPHGSMADPMTSSITLIQDVMHLPAAPVLAYLVMLLETVGAVMLMAGIATRVIALAFAVEMAGICYALGPTWPWIDRGIEYPVLMLFLALHVAARGGECYSLDTARAERS